MDAINVRAACPYEPELGPLAWAMHLESERRHLPWAAEEVMAELVYHSTQSATHCGFVAQAAGRMVGFIAGRLRDFEGLQAQRLCSTFIYVVPAYRGSWAFLKLLQAFEGWAAARRVGHVEIGMSGGVNVERLEVMFARLGYELAGNVLAWRPGPDRCDQPAAEDGYRSRAVGARDADFWEETFRAAHARSHLRQMPFDVTSYRRSFEATATHRSSRLYELHRDGIAVGIYGLQLHKVALCRAHALKCFLALRVTGLSARDAELLQAVCRRLPAYQSAAGAHELFWLTAGTARPRATARLLRFGGFRSLGGTFIKRICIPAATAMPCQAAIHSSRNP